jgi:hypothetical protein
MRRIAFLVTDKQADENTHVVIMALTREYAKSHASHILGHDPDQYEITPLTRFGEDVFVMGTLK